jgi:hypothetical protein
MGKFKDEHGKTRVGKFLAGISNVAPGILELAGDLTGINALEKLGKAISKTSSISEEQKVSALELLKMDLSDEQEKTKRWESDNQSQSWLPRNIRPLVVANFTLLIDAVIISSMAGKNLPDQYLPILMTMGITAIGGYFTLREFGKTKR